MNSTAPQTPSDSPITTTNGIKGEIKDECPVSPYSAEPPSPKFVEEKVEVWAGLCLPLSDSKDGSNTGNHFKTTKCLPVLQLDGLEPEVVYQRPEDNLIFAEFLPRKRLKRSAISEKSEPLGIKRLPVESQPTKEELGVGDSGSTSFKTDRQIKTEPNYEKNIDDSYTANDEYSMGLGYGSGILTPSPEQKMDEASPYTRYQPVKKPIYKAASPGIAVYGKKVGLELGDPNHPSSTLTPPTPKMSTDVDIDIEEVPRSRRKSTYELAEEKAKLGLYAPFKVDYKNDSGIDDAFLSKIPKAYEPSWTPGSNSFKIREERKRKNEERRLQKELLSRQNANTASSDQNRRPSMRQPGTPGSASHGGPKTPGMAPSTPGAPIAPPGTPGNPTTPGGPYNNPRTPGGPPSVGPLTPFGAPHTPRGGPHTPGASSARSPGQAMVAPSPGRRDFSAPKTPRTPRTPGSVRTPGKGTSFGSIRGVSSLQEVSALLLSLVLGDSVLDAHRDRNFIQAPLCVCRNDVVGADGHLLGLRSSKPNNTDPDDDEDECRCGFSAIASRNVYNIDSKTCFS